jgi:hypothetical protein
MKRISKLSNVQYILLDTIDTTYDNFMCAVKTKDSKNSLFYSFHSKFFFLKKNRKWLNITLSFYQLSHDQMMRIADMDARELINSGWNYKFGPS